MSSPTTNDLYDLLQYLHALTKVSDALYDLRNDPRTAPRILQASIRTEARLDDLRNDLSWLVRLLEKESSDEQA